MPKISVIVPVYKVEPYLHRCVDSILNQTFQDFELLLVDDGSPDNCPQICDEYAQKDSRVFVIHKENGGLSDARNKGIDWAFENSNSEWITFIDSDDWISASYLKTLYDMSCKYNVDISACDFHYTLREWDPNAENDTIKLYTPDEFWGTKKTTNIIACCKLFRKDILRTIRFPEGRIYEDTACIPKIIFSAKSLAFVSKRLYFYFYNPDSIMHEKWSERKLQQAQALWDQIQFFKKIRKKRFKQYAFDQLIRCYYNNIISAQKAQINGEYEKTIKTMRKQLARILIRHPKIKAIRHYEEIYIACWPKRRRLISFFKKVDNKLARIFKWDK